MKKTLGRLTFGFMIFIILLFVLVAMTTGKKKKSPKKEYEEIEVDESLYKDLFIEGCTVHANEEYCLCAYDYLEDKHGVDGLVDMSLEYKETDKFPDEFKDAAYECIKFLK